MSKIAAVSRQKFEKSRQYRGKNSKNRGFVAAKNGENRDFVAATIILFGANGRKVAVIGQHFINYRQYPAPGSQHVIHMYNYMIDYQWFEISVIGYAYVIHLTSWST